MRIIPIASGKGGVGKSLIAANLSIALVQAGKKVILADMDLGGSNLHMFLGLRPGSKGLGTYLSNSKMGFKDIIINTDYKDLRFIPGDCEIPGIANLTKRQKTKLIKNLLSLKADFLIIDLSAGTNFDVIDFFLTSGSGIIVTMPTLTAILNAYLFLKNALFRIIYLLITSGSKAQSYLKKLQKQGNSLQEIYLVKFLAKIKEFDNKLYDKYMQKVERFKPKIILNLLEDQKDMASALKLRKSSREYLGMDLEHLGIIYRDDMQDKALNSRIPILIYKPHSVLSQAICRIADKLIQNLDNEQSPLTLSEIEKSYQIANMEAEIDFQEKLHYIQELMYTGDLSFGDLIDIIKSQHIEINNLKKENQLLKTKLARALRQGFKI